MSFDVSMTCNHCNSQIGCDFNITHNVNSIVDRCLTLAAEELGLPPPKARTGDSGYAERSWGRLVGWTGFDALPIVERATRISMDPARAAAFRELEPPNKWGDLEGVQECLGRLRDACAAFPAGVIDANG